MASRRFIDRGFWRCPELNECSAEARLLGIYLLTTDREDGCVPNDPPRFNEDCFKSEGLQVEWVEDFVDELVCAGLLGRELRRNLPMLRILKFADNLDKGDA